MRGLLQDCRYGVRMLARNAGATLVVITTLALAIGATTAIFSVVYGVMLRSLPYPRPDRLVSISEVAQDGHLMNFADPNFDDLRDGNHSFAEMAKSWHEETTVSGGSAPGRVEVAVVSRDFFRVMGVEPVVGRGFLSDELHEGGTPAALVSYGYWKQHLGSSTDLSS